MSLFGIILGKSNKKVKNIFNKKDTFNQEAYDIFNNEKILEFKNRYDLNSVSGIRAIPKEEAKRYSDGGKSVVYMPEQILSRQATEYKKTEKYDLAIECLKKANEMYPLSFYAYTRNDYERLVDFLVLAGRFDEAKEEHKRIDKLHGTRLDELHELQNFCANNGDESKEDYQKRIINPYIDEARDREQYYWLLENFPEIAPKSFSGYRRMKNLESSTYKKIQYEVQKKGFQIEKIKFWI